MPLFDPTQQPQLALGDEQPLVPQEYMEQYKNKLHPKPPIPQNTPNDPNNLMSSYLELEMRKSLASNEGKQMIKEFLKDFPELQKKLLASVDRHTLVLEKLKSKKNAKPR